MSGSRYSIRVMGVPRSYVSSHSMPLSMRSRFSTVMSARPSVHSGRRWSSSSETTPCFTSMPVISSVTLFDIDQPSCGVVASKPVGVALGDELAVLEHDDAAGAERLRAGRQVVAERAADRRVERGDGCGGRRIRERVAFRRDRRASARSGGSLESVQPKPSAYQACCRRPGRAIVPCVASPVDVERR